MKIKEVSTTKYEWNCPNCPDAGVKSDNLEIVKYCKKIHKCCGKKDNPVQHPRYWKKKK